jgi:hypothetical protein
MYDLMGLKTFIEEKQKTGTAMAENKGKIRQNLFFWNAFVMFDQDFIKKIPNPTLKLGFGIFFL